MKNNNKGFSLVELIVVIAIMAILAAVAVVGFSMYIPKAQQAADKQLVSDVEYALNLSMQTGEIKDHPIGKLVLSQGEIVFYGTNGQVTDLTGTDVEKVLIASFGTAYKNELKLKYDSWTASSSLVNGMLPNEANVVKNSSYLSGDRADVLLQDVEKFTDMAANLAGSIDASLGTNNSLVALYGPELLDETARKYGIYDQIDDSYKNEDGSVKWDEWSAVTENKQTFSNMLVFAAATDKQNLKEDDTYQVSSATNLIDSFSTYYGFAANCPEFSLVLDDFMDAMNAQTATTIDTPYGQVTVQPVTDASSGAAWYSALNAELQKGYKNKDGKTYAEYCTGENSDAARDKAAFGCMLSSLGNVSADDLGSMDSASLFTQGAVKGKYDEYLGAVDLMSGYAGDFSVNPGEVAIIYNQNLIVIENSIGQ